MGIKTNSKQAITAVHNYIMDGFSIDSDKGIIDADNYNRDFPTIAKLIFDDFINQKGWEIGRFGSTQQLFVDWLQGLPSVIDSCYYYNRSAVQDLGNILNQTESERNRYTEQQAEQTLSYLIFREIYKHSKGV